MQPWANALGLFGISVMAPLRRRRQIRQSADAPGTTIGSGLVGAEQPP